MALVAPGFTDHLYLEVAAGVTLFILLGRYLEARAKRRPGAALRALASGRQGRRGPRRAGERRVPRGELRPATGSSCGPAS